MKTPKATKATDEATDDTICALLELAPPATKEELIKLCVGTTRLSLKRDSTKLKLDKLENRLHEKYGLKLEEMEEQIGDNVELMHLWADENREEEFKERQGIEVAGCELEYQKGSGKIVAARDDHASLRKLRALPPQYNKEKKQLVRIKFELNKAAALAMAKTPEGRAFLKKIELSVVVDEKFKFKPARADLTPLAVVSPRS